MASATVTGVYATALLDLAQERNEAAAVVAAGHEVAAAFTREVVQALEQPGLNRQAARDAISAALAQAPVEIRNLALLLLERGRLGALPAILLEAVALFEARHGVRHVTVTTAAPLTADSQERVSKALHHALGAGVRLESTIDHAIIGGLTLRYGDTLVDGSVRRSLDEMKARMLAVPVGSTLWADA